MTEELAVGHYVKRLAAIDILFGDAAFQRTRFAQLRADTPPAEFIKPHKRWKQI